MAAVAASYRIGPTDSFTPGDLAADADTLNSQIGVLDDSPMDAVSEQFFDGWQLFLSQWKRFYSDHFGGFFSNFATALNNANRDQLISFERQFLVWADQYKAQGGTLPGALLQPSEGTQATLGDHLKSQFKPLADSLGVGVASLTVFVLVIVGAIIAWKVWDKSS